MSKFLLRPQSGSDSTGPSALKFKKRSNDELLLIRLMASPNIRHRQRVTFTPSISGAETVSVVINFVNSRFRSLSMPKSFKIAWETQA